MMCPPARWSTPTCRLASCLALLLAVSATHAPAQVRAARVEAALIEMSRQAGAPVERSVSRHSGLASFVAVPQQGRVRLSLPASAPVEARAEEVVRSFGEAFGITRLDQLTLSAATSDVLGNERVRFRQTIGGVPVAGGELSVHLRGRDVVAVHAKTIPDEPSLDVVPTLDATAAQDAALAHLARVGILGTSTAPAELQVFNRGLLEARSTPSRLAWFVAVDAPGRHEYVWIDAESGTLLLRFDQRPTLLQREIYDANNVSGAFPGDLVRVEGGLPAADADANLVYDYLGDAYDYFLNEHGRDSYNGFGAPLRASVDLCFGASCPQANAFWDSVFQWFGFGEGFGSADDVVAHELAHAFTSFTANLFYYMQSGALNESYSDIFGETVDLLNGAGDDAESNRWLIGEDIVGFDVLRDMSDPTTVDHPGKTSDSELVCFTDAALDNGGVHSNSGIPNHAYALMVDGGTYNGSTVSGIGLTKAGKIQYRALSEYLLSASDFLDNYHALRASCRDLVGTDGITFADCHQVDAAIEAVEMHHPWPCSAPLPTGPELCPGGGSATTLFSDDFESTLSPTWEGSFADFYHWGSGTGTDNLYELGFATSGLYSLHGRGVNLLGDSLVFMTTDVAVPAGGARMQFSHSYGFEESGGTFFDGGMVEYSTDSGTTWFDAGNLMAQGARYRGTLFVSNPQSGRAAFVGDSHGYTATQLDLTSLAEQNVRFRFRMASDSFAALGSADSGWFVDDVHVYTCAGGVPLVTQLDSPSTAGVNSQQDEPSEAVFDTQAADDFASGVPVRIGVVDVRGFYTAGSGPTPLLNLSFHADDSGFPGTELCSYQGLRAGIDFDDTFGSFRAKLPAACCLPAGTHWLVAQADMDFGTDGIWAWRQRTVQSGHPFRWRNPGDGYGSGCTDWTDGASCFLDPDPDMLFALWQVPAAPAHVTIDGLTIGTLAVHEASTTLTVEDLHVSTPGAVLLRAGTSVRFRGALAVANGSTLRVQIAPPNGCP